MPVWLFNILLAILLVGTPVSGATVELAERDETAQHETPSEKRAFRLETPVPPQDPGRREVHARATVIHLGPALHATASQKFLPPRQFTERRLI